MRLDGLGPRRNPPKSGAVKPFSILTIQTHPRKLVPDRYSAPEMFGIFQERLRLGSPFAESCSAMSILRPHIRQGGTSKRCPRSPIYGRLPVVSPDFCDAVVKLPCATISASLFIHSKRCGHDVPLCSTEINRFLPRDSRTRKTGHPTSFSFVLPTCP